MTAGEIARLEAAEAKMNALPLGLSDEYVTRPVGTATTDHTPGRTCKNNESRINLVQSEADHE